METAVLPSAIEGVWSLPLRVIPTDGGNVLHMIRADSPHFKGFGEMYFSEVLPGGIRAWKCHTRQTQLFAVPVGRMQVVVYDDRPESPTRGAFAEFLLGRPEGYVLLGIAPGVWYGFRAVGGAPALLANCADMPHDPEESLRLPRDTPRIPYVWKKIESV